jgi:hypothetical protein
MIYFRRIGLHVNVRNQIVRLLSKLNVLVFDRTLTLMMPPGVMRAAKLKLNPTRRSDSIPKS